MEFNVELITKSWNQLQEDVVEGAKIIRAYQSGLDSKLNWLKGLESSDSYLIH